jgi:hypothetical protein
MSARRSIATSVTLAWLAALALAVLFRSAATGGATGASFFWPAAAVGASYWFFRFGRRTSRSR